MRQAGCIASRSYAIATDLRCSSLKNLQQKVLAYIPEIQQPENGLCTVGKSNSILYANYHNRDRGSRAWEVCQCYPGLLNGLKPAQYKSL